jgi:hypothetical protein
MTPEEHLKKMRQDHRWDAPDPRPRTNVFGAAPRRAWGSVAIAVGLIAVSALVVVGAVSLRTLPRAEPAGSPIPTATYNSERPVPRLDLACSDVLSNDDIDEFLGKHVAVSDYLGRQLSNDLLLNTPAGTIQAGGTACDWHNDDPDDHAGVRVKILPDGVSSKWGELDGVPLCSDITCIVQFAVGTTFVQIQSNGHGTGATIDELKATFSVFESEVTAAIESAGEPAPPPTITGAVPTQCASVVSADQMAGIVGVPITIRKPGKSPAGVPQPQDQWPLEMLGALVSCGYNESDTIYGPGISMVPGAGWIVDEYGSTAHEYLAGVGTLVYVEGLEGRGAAYSHCEEGSYACVLDLAVDGNWYVITSPKPDAQGETPTVIDYGKPTAEVLTDIAAQIVANMKK